MAPEYTWHYITQHVLSNTIDNTRVCIIPYINVLTLHLLFTKLHYRVTNVQITI